MVTFGGVEEDRAVVTAPGGGDVAIGEIDGRACIGADVVPVAATPGWPRDEVSTTGAAAEPATLSVPCALTLISPLIGSLSVVPALTVSEPPPSTTMPESGMIGLPSMVVAVASSVTALVTVLLQITSASVPLPLEGEVRVGRRHVNRVLVERVGAVVVDLGVLDYWRQAGAFEIDAMPLVVVDPAVREAGVGSVEKHGGVVASPGRGDLAVGEVEV